MVFVHYLLDLNTLLSLAWTVVIFSYMCWLLLLLFSGTAAQGSPLLASLPVQGRPLQTHLDLKHFLPFRLSGSSPLNLFPNFNAVSSSALLVLFGFISCTSPSQMCHHLKLTQNILKASRWVPNVSSKCQERFSRLQGIFKSAECLQKGPLNRGVLC